MSLRKQMYVALQAIALCPETNEWLERYDPLALRQVLRAIKAHDEKYPERVMENGCLFPDSHDTGHLPTRKFAVVFHNSNDWEDLTETEIMARESATGFLHTSDWDHWYESPMTGETVPQSYLDFLREYEREEAERGDDSRSRLDP